MVSFSRVIGGREGARSARLQKAWRLAGGILGGAGLRREKKDLACNRPSDQTSNTLY